jgi:hypothetical protein
MLHLEDFLFSKIVRVFVGVILRELGGQKSPFYVSNFL